MSNEFQPLVSIITPCFNSAKYIRECIESLLTQTYPNVEQIIQDGGSTDGTLEIIKEYVEKYPEKIFVKSEPDKGQSDGLNKAIQRSKGDILIVLNADDAFLPHACSWAVENIANYPEVAVIYGDEYIMDKDSNIIDESNSPEYSFEKLLCLELIIPAQAAFIRRTHFKQVGFYADKDLDTCPDYEMWVRIGLKFPMKKIPGFVSKYRRFFQPAMESGKLKTAKRFFEAKKLVLDRVFASPTTPQKIKDFQLRAYSGLVVWTVITEMILNNKKHNLFFFWESLSNYRKLIPTKSIYIVRDVLITGIMYFKRIAYIKLKYIFSSPHKTDSQQNS